MTRHPHRAAASTVAAAFLAAVLTSCGTTPEAGPPDPAPPPRTAAPTDTKAPTEEPSEAEALPTGAAATPPGVPDPQDVDRTNPDAVSKAALTTMLAVDTRADVSQHDATLRAVPYATPKYARQIKATPQRSAPGADWQAWAAHQAFLKVDLQAANEAGAPADTATDAYRTWAVTTTPHGRSGWKGQEEQSTAFVHLTRSGKKWSVDAVQIQ